MQSKEDKVKEVKRIKLSVVVARYLWPVYLGPQNDFAQKILSKMKR